MASVEEMLNLPMLGTRDAPLRLIGIKTRSRTKCDT